MSISKFNTSIVESKRILSEIGLFKSLGVKVINRDDVSPEFKTASQKKSYFDLYKCAIRNFDYDILLNDDSIFQFSYGFDASNKTTHIRFAFFQNPQEYKTYPEFLQHLRDINYLSDETDEDLGDSFEEEYQQFLREQSLNTSSTSIRYDFDSHNYRPSLHSISHLHIGHQNDIRIPCKLILTPINFCIFVIKHVYYSTWKFQIANPGSSLKSTVSSSKLGCYTLALNQWLNDENSELFLS
ncbi:DUF2290 domain-containing protein [Pedobacter sp. R-06]|uniref:DUF2290 domain-containing protein n=1 Tax=Pedobacter sp. R-06 TaxID=3404051 RepID=UPI003CF8048E